MISGFAWLFRKDNGMLSSFILQIRNWNLLFCYTGFRNDSVRKRMQKTVAEFELGPSATLPANIIIDQTGLWFSVAQHSFEIRNDCVNKVWYETKLIYKIILHSLPDIFNLKSAMDGMWFREISSNVRSTSGGYNNLLFRHQRSTIYIILCHFVLYVVYLKFNWFQFLHISLHQLWSFEVRFCFLLLWGLLCVQPLMCLCVLAFRGENE